MKRWQIESERTPDLGNFVQWLESLSEVQLREYLADWYWKHKSGSDHINVLHHFAVERTVGHRLVMDGKPPIQDWRYELDVKGRKP